MSRSGTLGFVGLGSMGSAMAPHLAKAGHKTIGFDQNTAAAASLIEAGGSAATSVAEIGAQADIVFMSLPTPAIVRDVALNQLAPGKPRVIVDLSTTGPRVSSELAKELNDKGIAFVDAPVSGGRAGALAGKLSLMAACSKELWAEIEPLLTIFGKVFYIGEEAGQAQTMKLINNIMSTAAIVVTAEGMAMGAKAGLNPNVMLDVLNASSGRNSATGDKFPRAVVTRTFDFGFATGLSLKDTRLCLEEAGAMGVPMLMGNIVRTVLEITQSKYGPQSDFTKIAEVVEQWAGTEIKG